MAVTLGTLVEQVKGHLNQYSTNQEQLCTFVEWVLSGADKIGVKLDDVTEPNLNNVDVEIGGVELVRVTSYNADTMQATCPPWFRQMSGTPLSEPTANTMATINPRWPSYRVAEKIVHGINSLYPFLFAAKVATLTSRTSDGNYEMPDDIESVIDFNIQGFTPESAQFKVGTFSLDPLNSDGKRYLRTNAFSVAGRPIEVLYRAKPVAPDPAVLSTTWASTGLPDSAQDLPVLFAVAALLPSADAAKTQTASVEQSDRSRLVQSGSANSTSRRFQEMFQNRLVQEQRKLENLYPPRLHRSLSR